jgi:hypothetical protein
LACLKVSAMVANLKYRQRITEPIGELTQCALHMGTIVLETLLKCCEETLSRRRGFPSPQEAGNVNEKRAPPPGR